MNIVDKLFMSYIKNMYFIYICENKMIGLSNGASTQSTIKQLHCNHSKDSFPSSNDIDKNLVTCISAV